MYQDKKTPASARKPVKRKAKDKPKRPLSAYNFFFKEEREKIVAVVLNEDPSSEDVEKSDLTAEEITKLRKDTGKVNFEEMGKLIGSRWRVVSQDPDRKQKYDTQAGGDTLRYKDEMEKYNKKQEELREKEKQRAAEMQYAQMAAQQYPGHPMMRNSEMPGMFPAQMGYPYPMDPNAHPHAYTSMQMIGAGFNPYYMPPHNAAEEASNPERNAFPPQGNFPMMPHSRYPPNEYYPPHNVPIHPSEQAFYAQQQAKQTKKSPPQNIEASNYPQQSIKEENYPQQSYKEDHHPQQQQQSYKDNYPQQQSSYKEDNYPQQEENYPQQSYKEENYKQFNGKENW